MEETMNITELFELLINNLADVEGEIHGGNCIMLTRQADNGSHATVSILMDKADTPSLTATDYTEPRKLLLEIEDVLTKNKIKYRVRT